MSSLPNHIAEYADALRAELAAENPTNELLVETCVIAAIRLKLLHEDPRALDPWDETWTRVHAATLRAFFRAYDTLKKRRRFHPGPVALITPAPGRLPTSPSDRLHSSADTRLSPATPQPQSSRSVPANVPESPAAPPRPESTGPVSEITTPDRPSTPTAPPRLEPYVERQLAKLAKTEDPELVAQIRALFVTSPADNPATAPRASPN